MPKAKKPIHDDSQIEEIDLSQIDAANINIPAAEDTFKAKKKDTSHKEKDGGDVTLDDSKDDISVEDEFEHDFEDDFDEFEDDFEE